MEILKATQLTKVYGGKRGSVAVTALKSFNLDVLQGEFVVIMGPSGSGKTTLLQVLSGIDLPTSGQVAVEGQALPAMKRTELALFRRRRLGFIFQEFNLLDALTLKENIALPLALEGCPAEEIESRATALGNHLGISDAMDRYPYEVSGGQKQRAAAARALIHKPALILADEPTGNLDSKAARSLMENLADLNSKNEATILMVTHDPVMASYAQRIVFIKDGENVAEIRKGDDRRSFYQHILDALATLGGESLEYPYTVR